MKISNKIWALVIAGTMVAGLSACGGSGANATAATESAGQSQVAAEPVVSGSSAAAESSAESAATASDKEWIIATDTVFVPFEYTDDTGKFVGIDVDILDAIAQDQGFKYQLNSLGWDGAVAAVQSGQADAIIAGASITDERKASGWIFSDGYYNATQTAAVAADSGITSFDDLKGKSVAVKNGTMGADYADSLKDQYGFTVTKFDDSPTMYQDVLAGNSAACFEDTPVMGAYIKQHDLALTIPDGLENEGSPYGLAIMKADNQELLDMFNAGLKNIQDNGKYDEILANYLSK